MSTSLPEVTVYGLILWRLRRSPEEQLWCSVRESAAQLTLIVQDPATPRTAATERHPDIQSLIERAVYLQHQLVGDGWQVVDVDLDEPD